jgi:hypothetical protein
MQTLVSEVNVTQMFPKPHIFTVDLAQGRFCGGRVCGHGGGPPAQNEGKNRRTI